MGKTYTKHFRDEDEGHNKNASRHGHSAKYKKQAIRESSVRAIPETKIRGLDPRDLLHDEELVNGLDYDD